MPTVPTHGPDTDFEKRDRKETLGSLTTNFLLPMKDHATGIALAEKAVRWRHFTNRKYMSLA